MPPLTTPPVPNFPERLAPLAGERGEGGCFPRAEVPLAFEQASEKTRIRDCGAGPRGGLPLSQISPSLRLSSSPAGTETGKPPGCRPPNKPRSPQRGECDPLGLSWLERWSGAGRVLVRKNEKRLV